LQFVEFRYCINRSSGEGRNNLIANYHSFVVCVVCGRTGRVKASCFLYLEWKIVFENDGKLRWDQQKISVLENYYHVVIVLENWKFL